MLDRDTRAAILRLARQGHGKKAIARNLGVGKHTVTRVLRSGEAEVPRLDRASQLDPFEETIRDLHHRCQGNLVRVHEELLALGTKVSYPTLTAFCRSHGIGVKPKRRAGHYHFAPGQEMQHDTSPHNVTIGGRRQRVECASLILCFSRKLYARVYARWSRLECRDFFSRAIPYLGGAAGRCVIDNHSVVIVQGSGETAVPAPEMAALARHFGFVFVAHAPGDANRSGRVERPFHYIEHNFYPGRTFADLDDLNAQLTAWCDRDQRRTRRHLKASPLELFLHEQPALKPVPLFIPEVYEPHRRRVDVGGYVSLHTNRYSVDAQLIGHRVDLRETIDRVRIFSGHRLVAEHRKQEYGARKRVTLPQHRDHWRQRHLPPPPAPEEQILRAQAPELAALVDALKRRYRGQATRQIRRLHRIWRDYPTEPVSQAAAQAVHYGLTDLNRFERMVLTRIAGDFFRLPGAGSQSHQDDHDG